jgi:hypothetical protein
MQRLEELIPAPKRPQKLPIVLSQEEVLQFLRSEPESPQQFVSIDRESREFAAPAFQTREHSITSPGANEVLRKFNRHTRWVAAGLSGTLLFAALAFVVLLPERHTMTAVLSERASQAEDTEAKAQQAQKSGELVASQRDTLQAQLKDTEAKAQQAQNDAELAAGQRHAPQVSYQPNSARTFRRKASYQSHRSARQLGEAEAKRRLLELWHRSLAKSETPKSRAIFSKQDK